MLRKRRLRSGTAHIKSTSINEIATVKTNRRVFGLEINTRSVFCISAITTCSIRILHCNLSSRWCIGKFICILRLWDASNWKLWKNVRVAVWCQLARPSRWTAEILFHHDYEHAKATLLSWIWILCSQIGNFCRGKFCKKTL